jgi:hypothetical protein
VHLLQRLVGAKLIYDESEELIEWVRVSTPTHALLKACNPAGVRGFGGTPPMYGTTDILESPP